MEQEILSISNGRKRSVTSLPLLLGLILFFLFDCEAAVRLILSNRIVNGAALRGFIHNSDFSHTSAEDRLEFGINSQAAFAQDHKRMSKITLTSDDATYGNGSFWTFNNVWGKGTLVNGVDYTQSITFDDTTFPNGVTMSWNWPATKSVQAFPEIIYGASPYQAAPSGVTALPPSTQVANFINLSTQYSFATSGQTKHFDIAFDIWLTSEPSGGRATIQYELMIVVHNPWGWYKRKTPDFSTGGINVWNSGSHGNGTSTWTMLSAISPADKLSGTISISDILKGLIWDGSLTGNEYISGIEVGAEAAGGKGSLVINSLSYQWNGTPTIMGTAGNDTFNITSPGGNHVKGNGGTDTVVYTDSYSQFQIKSSGSEILVMKNKNTSTLDLLNRVAYIKFSDGSYDVVHSIFTPESSVQDQRTGSPR